MDICYLSSSQYEEAEEPDDDYALYCVQSGQVEMFYDYPIYNDGAGLRFAKLTVLHQLLL